MSDSDQSPDGVNALAKDHLELRNTMSSLNTSFARLEGKIDAMSAFLERISLRQDQGEARLSELEKEMRREVRRLEEKHQITQQKVWTAGGAVALLSVLIPIFLKIWSTK